MACFQKYCTLTITACFLVLGLSLAAASSFHSSRVRKQTGNTRYDVRNCDAVPPYIPETAFPSTNYLLKLREEMRKRDLDAYIIPAEDAHQSEYIADRDQRRKFMSGFSGYADYTINPWSGVAIVTRNKDYKTREKAAVWVDSRYFVQAKMEMDCNWLSMELGEENVLDPDDWLTGDTYEDSDEIHAQLPDGARIGFDPTLLSITTYREYNETFHESPRDIRLVPIKQNLVDIVWEEIVGGEENLPEYPGEELIVLDTTYTGRTWQSKIFYDDPLEDFETNVRNEMEIWGAQVLVIDRLDEIAWLFNLRGEDIPYNPVFIAYCIITNSDIRLYMYDGTKRTDDVRYRDVHLHLGLADCTSGPTCISLRNYEDFLDDLEELGQTSRVIWHSDQASYAIYERVRDVKRIERASPVLLMKAEKNDVEILGMKSAYLKDSVALCNLFGFIQEKMDNMAENIKDRGNINYLSELSVVDEAEQIRESLWGEVYHGKSFATISAFADHGGLIHYDVTEETNVPIHFGGMFLFNSGAQYKEGTTDLTRTFHFGKPTRKMIDAYTRALMGHIDLLTARLRTEVYGRELDGIAREPLWYNGLDYKHATGHGIGHFLNVREGPAIIAPGYREYEQPIAEGMFFTDEPGFYEEEEFGLRIGNVMYTKRAQTDYSFGTYTYLEFEVVSLIPFEPKLIDFSLLTRRQIEFYNNYMDRIRKEIGANPKLERRGKEWMEWKTAKVWTRYEHEYNGAAEIYPRLSLVITTLSVLVCQYLVRI